jgi:CheY-like chemotaxis protein
MDTRIDAAAMAHENLMPEQAPTAPVPTVLVVDDNRDTADSLCELLQMLGFETLVAYDGDQGVAIALEQHPAFVILDLHMPRMGGVLACTRIRQAPGMEAMKLVALTGSNQASDREAAELAGFDHFLVKPVMVGALLRLLGPAPAA